MKIVQRENDEKLTQKLVLVDILTDAANGEELIDRTAWLLCRRVCRGRIVAGVDLQYSSLSLSLSLSPHL